MKMKTFALAAVAAVGFGAAAHATTISIQTFSVAGYNGAVGTNEALETFESFANGQIGAPLPTNVGTFTTLGGDGNGDSVIGDGTQLAIHSGNSFGRTSTTALLGLCGDAPCPGKVLDSNDTLGISWDVDTGSAFNRIVFVLSDANDVGARIFVRSGDAAEQLMVGTSSGDRRLVVITFGSLVDGATVELDNGDFMNDGFSIDDVSVSVVPLPASALLLLAGMGGLAAMRRRKSAA